MPSCPRESSRSRLTADPAVKTAAKLLPFLCLLATAPALPADPAATGTEVTRRELVDWMKSHQLSEEEFIRASREPGTVVLDASEPETYRLMHVEGAINLAHGAMNAGTLGRVLPNENTRVLIYENTNYRAAENQRRARKLTGERGQPPVGEWSGENLATYQTLRRYGYRRIDALASYIRVDQGSLPQVVDAVAVDLGKPLTLSLNSVPR